MEKTKDGEWVVNDAIWMHDIGKEEENSRVE